MPYCINCGAEVRENETVCKDCGYSPKIKGKKMLKKCESVEGFEEVIKEKEAPKAVEINGAEEIFCPSCAKRYGKALYKCKNCGTINPYQDFPLHNYVIYMFLGTAPIVMLFLLTFSLIFVFASPSTLPYLWVGGVMFMMAIIIGVPVGGIITYMLIYPLGRFVKRKMFKGVRSK